MLANGSVHQWNVVFHNEQSEVDTLNLAKTRFIKAKAVSGIAISLPLIFSEDDELHYFLPPPPEALC